MKALTLTQPWASLVACGAKRIETRSWATKHRGPLAIHAGKMIYEAQLIDLLTRWAVRGGLHPVCGSMGSHHEKIWEKLPFGAVIATCTLVDVVPTDSLTVGVLDQVKRRNGLVGYDFTERQFGDFTPGRFGWMLEDICPIKPVPARGYQNLWDWDEVTQ